MRQTLFRRSLKELGSIQLEVKLLKEDNVATILPLTRTRLFKAIREVLETNDIKVKPGANVRLLVDVRALATNIGGITGMLVKMETTLRELVSIARNNLKLDVDTWRHRSTSAVFYGNSSIPLTRALLEAEVLRQVEAFADDVALSRKGTDDDPVESESIPEAPEVILDEANPGE